MVEIVYCILAYDEPELLKHTIKLLNYDNVSFIIHIQKSVDSKPFFIDADNVFYIPDEERIETIWGDISCVNAALLMFKYALDLFPHDRGYCVLMSGTDYPMKSNAYIQSYFDHKFPKDCIALTSSHETWTSSFRRVCEENSRDYWISHPRTKLKTWIRPMRFIGLRCFKNQSIIRALPDIITTLPLAFKLFITGNHENPYLDLLKKGDEYFMSQTWMQLSFDSVAQLVRYQNDELFARALWIHNPEEHLLQNILVHLNGTGNVSNTVLGGTKEVSDSDRELIESMLKNPEVLFYRKFHWNTCQNLIDYVDTLIAE